MKLLPRHVYAARSPDDSIVFSSSSGGVFTELARVIIKDGGVVVGAKWDSELHRVVHTIVDTENDLSYLRGSKYVISDMSQIYSEMDKIVESGQKILFSGTPCQVATIKKRYGNLQNIFLCSLICHSNVSRIFLEKYLNEIEKKNKCRVANIVFRDKRKGWHDSTVYIEFYNSEKRLIESWSQNDYMRLFFSGLATQQACYNCRFRAGLSGADLIIGDFWGIENTEAPYKDDKGVNAVLLYSDKAEILFNRSLLTKTPMEYEQVVLGNPYLEISPLANEEQRKRFFHLYKKVTLPMAMLYAQYDSWIRVFYIILKQKYARFIMNIKK